MKIKKNRRKVSTNFFSQNFKKLRKSKKYKKKKKLNTSVIPITQPFRYIIRTIWMNRRRDISDYWSNEGLRIISPSCRSRNILGSAKLWKVMVLMLRWFNLREFRSTSWPLFGKRVPSFQLWNETDANRYFVFRIR